MRLEFSCHYHRCPGWHLANHLGCLFKVDFNRRMSEDLSFSRCLSWSSPNVFYTFSGCKKYNYIIVQKIATWWPSTGISAVRCAVTPMGMLGLKSISIRKTVDMWVLSSWEVVFHSGLCLTRPLQSFLKQNKLLPQQAARKAGFPLNIDHSL